MPGLYLAAILTSTAGVLVCDARWKLALWDRPARTGILLAVGWVFLLAWDIAGITAGVFVRGTGPWFLGIDIAPHLPVEELVFLAFLTYLALVLFAVFARVLPHRRDDRDRAAE
jgi:lycopene cyclase domain-containing protein